MPFLLIFAILLGWADAGFAMVISTQAVEAQLAQAPLVAEVLIQGVESVPRTEIFATQRANAVIQSIIRSPKDGPIAGQEITIEVIGGEIADRGMIFSGIPRPRTGKRYRAYLTPQGEGYTIAGHERGLVDLSPTRQYSRNRTDGSNGEGTGPFLYWDDSFLPIPYYISAPSFQGLPSFAAAIDDSFKSWRDPQDVRVEFLPMGCSSGTKNENDGMNHIILVTDSWPFSDPQVIAITRNFYIAGTSDKAGLILDSDILLNGVHHRFTTTDETGANDVQNIVTHEAGHFLGLGHEIVGNEDTQATMFANAQVNEKTKRTLKASDLAGLHEAYHGVGIKHPWATSNCNLTGSSACAAVHRSDGNAWPLFWAITYLAILLALGRAYRRVPLF